MRFRLLVLLVAAGVSLDAAAAPTPPGSLDVEGASGLVVVRGHGGLLGHLDHGSVQVLDLTPNDPWKWALDGKSVIRHASIKGSDHSFRILGGDYRLIVRGDGISISARGNGIAYLQATHAPSGLTGSYSTNLNADCQAAPETCTPIPTVRTNVPFGPQPIATARPAPATLHMTAP